MMDAALVINGVVDTVYRGVPDLENLPAVSGGQWVEAGTGVFAGFVYADGEFTAPSPAPEPPPDEISDRQFAQALWKQETITLEEAKAFVKVGEVPATLLALIQMLPEDQRDDADLMISGSTTFRRTHPVTEAIRLAFGWSETQRDDFWRFAASL